MGSMCVSIDEGAAPVCCGDEGAEPEAAHQSLYVPTLMVYDMMKI